MKGLNELLTWMETEDYHSHDWYDIKPIQRPRYIRAIPNRFFKLFPEIRLHNTPRTKASMAMGLLASTYFMVGDAEKGEKCLQWLLTQGNSRDGWGLPFTWYLPGEVVAPPNTGLITIMPYILEGFERGYAETKDERYLNVIKKSTQFIDDLTFTAIDKNTVRSSYTKLDNFHIINASSYTAMCLHKIWSITKEKRLNILSKKLVRYVVQNQNSDGSWYYWENQGKGIDSLHQLYIIENLWQCGEKGETIEKALDYFNQNLITKDGVIRKFPNNNVYFELIDQAEYQIMTRMLDLDGVNIDIIRKRFGLKDKPYFTPYIYHNRKVNTPFIRWGLSQLAYASAIKGEDI